MPPLGDLEEVRSFIRGTSKDTAIYVGCDSKQTQDSTVFVSVVVVHIDSCKGAKIFWRVEETKKILSLRQRLMEEVSRAVLLALEIADAVEDRPFEVHLDISPLPEHKSSVIVKEAVGYVMAQGLKPILKPDSIASSSVADFLLEEAL